MKKILLASALVLSMSPAFAGESIGIPTGDPFGGLPNGVPEIDGAKVNAFWSCFFAPKCNAFELDLSEVSDEDKE